MRKIVIELIKYGASSNSPEKRCALSLARTIDIASKENFKDILDISKIILATYGDRYSDGSFCLKPISEKLCAKIFELEKTTRKRVEQNLINKIDNLIKE